jgi:hypothetical protein
MRILEKTTSMREKKVLGSMKIDLQVDDAWQVNDIGL